ncbi:hypothetical protein RB628_32485 [Streptomyces sp. ADMS]|uniref:hypothetical protein n=1 Tax=Streptomyces sp. ADMS TaxID=3071415 RepID=UPI00296FD89C|nr:hypothetical protein [Streptomyces sp. ADMS]MDW4909924.1 hypothetical protein [Streptomyces sp. ADMS]
MSRARSPGRTAVTLHLDVQHPLSPPLKRLKTNGPLRRERIMIAAGAALALLFGFAMTRYYDSKALERLTPQPS